jgi:hypothetical protein
MAEKLWRHLTKTGLMRNFIESDLMRGQVTDIDFETGPIVWGCIDRREGCNLEPHELQIPFFSNLLKRQNIPKECIVCTEEKFEIDFSVWEQLNEACASLGWSWTWTILEYPSSHNQRCTHSLDVCRLCVAEHISVALDDGNFERIMCPQCDRMFTYDEIKKLCPDDTFRK